jgi:hypothetical protein
MTRSTSKVVRVLVASPGDLEVERDAIEAAVEELNLGLGASTNTRLEVIRWESHASPELGTDPQAILNQQLGDNFDVFIGLLWARTGTPTPRADSGTIEEFERAKARWENDPDSVSVKFYFKEEPINPWEIDPRQLARAQRFRSDLQTYAIYGTFVSVEDLGRLIRIHLTKHLLGGASSSQGVADAEPDSSEEATESEEDGGPGHRTIGAGDGAITQTASDPEDEEGLLDLVEEANESLAESTSVLTRMTDSLQALTQTTREAARGIEASKTETGQADLKKAKKAVNDLATDMIAISARFEADVPLFRTSFRRGMDAFIRGTRVSAEFGDEAVAAIRGNREAVASLAAGSHSVLDVVENLRNSTDRLPRMTTAFNRARKRLSSVLAEVHREFSAANTLAREAVAMVDDTLGQLGGSKSNGS